MDFFSANRRRLKNAALFIPDFAGYGLTRLFALFKPPQATIDYALKIRDEAGARDLYVFFDPNGEISLNSPLSVTTTPTAEMLGDLVIGTINIEILSIFCLISAIELTQEGSGGHIVWGGQLVVEGGKAGIRQNDSIDTNGFKRAGGLTEFNGNFSTLAYGKNNASGGFNWQPMLQTNLTTWATYQHQHTPTADGHTRFRNTGGTTYATDFTGLSSTSKKVTVSTVNKNVELKAYTEGVLTGTIAITGNLSNNKGLTIYRHYTAIGGEGIKQTVAVFNRTLTPTEVQELTDIINAYYI